MLTNIPGLLPPTIQTKPLSPPLKPISWPVSGPLIQTVPSSIPIGNVPMMIVPTSVNTSSSVIINSNYINNPNYGIAKANEESAKGLFAAKAQDSNVQIPVLTSVHQGFSQAEPVSSVMNVPYLQSQTQPLSAPKTAENLGQAQQTIIFYPMNALQKPAVPIMPLLPSTEAVQMGNPTSIMSRAPMQVQYMTSLYMPYSQNNYYNNYCPVMFQPSVPMRQPNVPIHSQMHVNNILSTGTPMNVE
jgi:hypothetical protein